MTQIKVNSGQVNPQSINVYVGGQWLMRKVGKVFNGGLWKTFISYASYLYNLGVETVSIVVGAKGGSGGSTVNTYTEYPDHIYLYTYRDSGSTSYSTAVTNLSVDLTGKNKVFVDLSKSGTGSWELIASTDKLGSNSIFNAKTSGATVVTRQVYSLDVTALNGMFFIRLHAVMTNDGGGSTVDMFRLWTE